MPASQTDPRGIHRLMYYSRQAFQRQSNVDFEIGLIIQKSIVNNRLSNVTGLLMLHQDWFIQVLEGAPQAVLTIYGKISRDLRHSGASVIAAGPAAAREFGDWNMCARRVNDADSQILDVLDQRGPFHPSRLAPDVALKLLRTVARVQRDHEYVSVAS